MENYLVDNAIGEGEVGGFYWKREVEGNAMNF